VAEVVAAEEAEEVAVAVAVAAEAAEAAVPSQAARFGCRATAEVGEEPARVRRVA
jgi:hypothetical protein